MKQQFIRTPRRLLTAFLALALALVLAACDVKVETQINFETIDKGTRTMVATYTPQGSDDAAKLAADVAKADAAIKKVKPAEINYLGYKIEGQTAQFTFNFAFTSQDDYRQKITALLIASKSTVAPKFTFASTTEGLVQGTQVIENFSSDDLLGWALAAMVPNGVMTADERSSLTVTNGPPSATINGTSFKSSQYFERFDINEVEDNGFDAIQVVLTPDEKGAAKVLVSYHAPETPSAVAQKQIDDFFKQQLTSGMTRKDGSSFTGNSYGSGGYAFDVAFDATSMEDLTKKLNTALGSTESTIAMQRGASVGDPTLEAVKFSGNLRCDLICSVKNYSSVSLVVVPPSAWVSDNDPTSVGAPTSGEFPPGAVVSKGETFSVDFSVYHPLKSTDVKATLAGDGSADLRFTYVLDAASAKVVGKGYEATLRPAQGVGKFTATTGAKETTYVVDLHGDTVESLQAAVQKYIPGSRISVKEEGGGLWPKYQLSFNVPVSQRIVNGSNKYTFSAALPQFNSFDDDQTIPGSTFAEGRSGVSVDMYAAGPLGSTGEQVTVKASGPTTTNLVWLGIIAGLIVVLLVAGVIFRRRVVAVGQAVWGKRGTVVQGAAVAAASAAAGASAVASAVSDNAARAQAEFQQHVPGERTPGGPVPAAAATPAASWSEGFTEHHMT